MSAVMDKEYVNKSSSQRTVADDLNHAISNLIKNQVVITSDDNDRMMKFTVLELGAGPGNNSVQLWKTIVRNVKSKANTLNNKDCEISFYLEDLPENNWTSVFQFVNDEMRNDKNLFFSAIGKSFYGPDLLPENSVDLMISSTALHWCPPSVVENVPETIFAFVKSTNVTGEIYARVQSKMKAAWLQLFTNRWKELKPNGVVAVAVPFFLPDDTIVASVKMSNDTFPFSSLPASASSLKDKMAGPVFLFAFDEFSSFFHNDVSHLFTVLEMKKQEWKCKFSEQYQMDKKLDVLAENVFDARLAVYKPYLRHQMQTIGKMDQDAINDIFTIWKKIYIAKCIEEKIEVNFSWGSAVVVLKKKSNESK